MNQEINQKSSRSLFWDVVKGWGIVFIVLGHCGFFGTAFIYLFHVALFFFITGYLYNEKKYGDTPFLYFCSRLSGCWPKYMLYTLFLVLIHNKLVQYGIYYNQQVYDHTRMLAAWLNSITFESPETLQGAMWFVPVWLISAGLFAGCVKVSRVTAGFFSKDRLYMISLAFYSFVLGLMGYFLTMRRTELVHNLHIALLVVPVYWFAFMLKRMLGGRDLHRILPWYGCIISAVLLHLVNIKAHIFIDLVSMNIPGLLFYPVSLLGIYFALSFSAITERIHLMAKLLVFLGKHSFDIMALHFAVFKFVDYVYARWIVKNVTLEIACFPVTYPNKLQPFYILFGLMIPTVIGCLVDKIASKLYR